MQKHPAQRSSLIMLCLDSGWLQRTFLDSLKSCRLCPGCGLEAAFRLSWIRLLPLLLGSLLCHFLRGCLRGFLCFLRFLGHVVLCKNTGSMNMRTPCIDMHTMKISQIQNLYQGFVKPQRRCQADRHPPAHAGDRRGRRDRRFAGATRCDADRRGDETMRMSGHWLRKQQAGQMK
jgi:hypothetical protein